MLLSDLHPMMRALAPEAPDPLLDLVLVEAAREVCRKTNAWRYELESSDLGKEGRTLVMTAPADAEILTVFSVEYGDDGPLDPQTPAQLARISATWRTDEGTESPSCYVYTPPLTLRLYPWATTLSLPDLVVTVALMPTLAATTLDDQIATQFSEVIRNLALSRLFLMPRKAWTSTQLGAGYATAAMAALDDMVEFGSDSGVRNLPRRVRYGGY